MLNLLLSKKSLIGIMCKPKQNFVKKPENMYTFIKTKIANKSLKKQNVFWVFAVLVSVIFYALLHWEPVYWNTLALTRVILVKLLPYWDWSPLFDKKCLVSSGEVKKEIAEDRSYRCIFCETLTTIEVLQNYSDYQVYGEYLERQIPIALDNVFNEWKWVNHKDWSSYVNDLLAIPEISDYIPCKVLTNLVPDSQSKVRTLLTKTKHYSSWFGHFKICDFGVVKEFRRLARRPKFFYPEISPVQYHWLLFSRNHTSHGPKPIALRTRYTGVIQVLGSTKYTLRPDPACENTCTSLEVTLSRGQALVFSTLWDLEYSMFGGDNNFAIIFESN